MTVTTVYRTEAGSVRETAEEAKRLDSAEYLAHQCAHLPGMNRLQLVRAFEHLLESGRIEVRSEG